MKQRNSSSIVYGAFILTAVNLFSQILQFAFRVWLSRLVSPQALGIYQLIMPVYSVIMSLCVSGVTVAVSRLTATYTALNNQRAVKQLVRNARLSYILLVLTLTSLCIPLSDFISVNFLGDARTRLGFILLFPCMLLTGWENVHKNYFYGVKNVIPPAVAEVLEQVTRTIAILGLLIMLHPLYEEAQVALIVVGMIISEVFSAGLLTFFYRRKMRLLPKTGTLLPKMTKLIASIAFPVACSNVASNLLSSINSIIIPGRLIASGTDPDEALSAFGVAFGMTMPLLSFSMAFMVAISLVMLPRLSEAIALGDMEDTRKKVKSALIITTVVVTVFTSILIPYGQSIARSLFKNPDAGAFMVPLAIATVFVCFEYVLGSFLNAMGKQAQAASNYIVAGIVQLVITWVAVARPELRLYGFVIAYMVGNALGAALNFVDVILAVRRKTD